MKKLGYHVVPTDHFLIDSLWRKVYEGAVEFTFPVIKRDLYSGEPWEVLQDDDPWDVLNPTEKATEFKRVIFVFTDLKPTGKKRFLRTAENGTWHGSTAEKPVRCEDGTILTGCFKSYLDFRPSKSQESTEEKGHWMMHEYKIKGLESMIPDPANINTVLCQITHVVNKDLGIRRNWPKSPFQICFRNLKSQGFFASRPNKTQEPSAAAASDDQQVLYTADSEHNDIQADLNGQDNRIGTTTSKELDIYIDHDDLNGFEFTFHQLVLPISTDHMQNNRNDAGDVEDFANQFDT